ncbi:MAG: hypothetical protein IPM56_04890 [Ignavibacteriales bacterium]|nr:MAG: hypothetical protein IPM56_04890 [Ignavibacteriales bacterium]
MKKKGLRKSIALSLFALLIMIFIFIAWPLKYPPSISFYFDSELVYVISLILLVVLFILKLNLKNKTEPSSNSTSGTEKNISENKKDLFLANLYEQLFNLIGIFISVLLAINLANDQSKESEKQKYRALLYTSIKLDEFYIDETERIINSRTESDYVDLANISTLEKAKEQFILYEVIKNGYLYSYASDFFKNWITTLINNIQKNDLTSVQENTAIIDSLRKYLIFKEDIVKIEIAFIDSSLDTSTIADKYNDAIVKLNGMNIFIRVDTSEHQIPNLGANSEYWSKFDEIRPSDLIFGDSIISNHKIVTGEYRPLKEILTRLLRSKP